MKPNQGNLRNGKNVLLLYTGEVLTSLLSCAHGLLDEDDEEVLCMSYALVSFEGEDFLK